MLEVAKDELFAMMADITEPDKEYKFTLTYSRREPRYMIDNPELVYYDYWIKVDEVPRRPYPSLR